MQNAKPASYAHFDRRVGLDTAWDYITNPDKVKTHGFFPFIRYDQIFYKVSNKKGTIEVKDKVRPICYSAHIDRCIYQYYSYMLNEKYNEYIRKEQISDCVVAYRNDLHKNNIHFAKQAFDFIKQGECDVIIGDFKSFFDYLDHDYLKFKMCEVLGEKFLPKDWYAVYKNITKYSTWELIDILRMNGLLTAYDIDEQQEAHRIAIKTGQTRRSRAMLKYFRGRIKILNGHNLDNYKEYSEKLALTKEEFKANKKEYVKPNKESFGIPQGSAISSVLSNVYMIDFDKKINGFIKEINGLYLRYSDDFIIVVPKNPDYNIDYVKDYLRSAVDDTRKLTLESNKTQVYSYKNNTIFNIKDPNNIEKSKIDYLGFIFDGEQVTLRPKTVSKYYYRMYKKLNNIVRCKGVTKKGRAVSYTKLYNSYTQKGRNGVYDREKFPRKVLLKNKNNPYKSGNFLSYVHKADMIFNDGFYDGYVEMKEPITQSTKRHMLKIRRVRDRLNEE